jgi:hypothetical protein
VVKCSIIKKVKFPVSSVAGFGISSVEPSGSAARELIIFTLLLV